VGEVEFEETAGASTTVVRRRAILPEHFMELPPPTPQTGVGGVFITPYTGAYTHSVPGSEIAAARRLSRTDVPNFLPRPKGHQELPPWTEEDYRRLGLRVGPARDDQQRTPPGIDPSRLRFVGRGGTNA
jgi:hypothetical protein